MCHIPCIMLQGMPLQEVDSGPQSQHCAVQAALPCLLYAVPDSSSSEPSKVSVLELRGGTDAPMAPSIDYLQHVLLPMLGRLFGFALDLQVGSSDCAQWEEEVCRTSICSRTPEYI